MCTLTPATGTRNYDPATKHYLLTEDQHTALYQARHTIELLNGIAAAAGEFADIRAESLSVTLGLLGDLLDEAMPNMLYRPREGAPC